jgi:hypothetical protein
MVTMSINTGTSRYVRKSTQTMVDLPSSAARAIGLPPGLRDVS